ncbi:MAG: glycosyltransferase family 9 protein [Terrimicrobiaceae bacterium]|nr:glycosyltransferase family 9 protein [Terrimicrobiaceae bacterium]
MRILLIQLKRIGDTLLTTPVLSALREHAPQARLTLALNASTAALAPALDADRILVRGDHFWRALATTRFDIALDFTGNDRSAVVTALSRAPRRITWARFARKPLRRLIYNEFVASSVRDRHTADHHTDLLRALDIHVEDVPLALRLPAAAQAEADQTLAAGGIATPFAVVHAGTARPEKYWLPERWAEVIAHLRTDHCLPVVLTGARDSAERAHLDAIQRALECSGCDCLDLAGKLSLLGTAAVLARARLLCAVDSAPAHFADALGTPLVVLFGPTDPFHWRPRGTNSRVVSAPQRSSMAEISTESVRSAIDDLAGPPGEFLAKSREDPS